MDPEKKVPTEELLQQLRDLTRPFDKKDVYDLAKWASERLSDNEWMAKECGGRIQVAAKKIALRISDYGFAAVETGLFTVGQLVEIYRIFPERKHWEECNYHLRRLWQIVCIMTKNEYNESDACLDCESCLTPVALSPREHLKLSEANQLPRCRDCR